MAISIILLCLGVIVYVAAGIVCGRICAELIHLKDKDLNEIFWFWAGFFLNFIAVIMTLVVKDQRDGGKN